MGINNCLISKGPIDQTNKSSNLPVSCFNLELMEKIMDVSDLKQLVLVDNQFY